MIKKKQQSTNFTLEDISKAFDVVIDLGDTIAIQWLSHRNDLSESQLEKLCLKKMNKSTALRLLRKVKSKQATENLLVNAAMSTYIVSEYIVSDSILIQNKNLPLEYRKTLISAKFLRRISGTSTCYLETQYPKDIWPYIKDQLMIKDIIE